MTEAARPPSDTLHQRWEYLHGKKSTILTRCEEYAKWTLPYLFPPVSTNSQASETQGSNDSIGARAVNHLSNKVVTTLFRPQGPFFRLRLGRKERRMLKKLTKDMDDAKIAPFIAMIENELSETEQEAVEYLDMVAYRPQATYAAQLLVTTGNALMYHPAGRPVQVFNLRDYCVVRDLSGEVIELMTQETKTFETFHPDVQIQLRAYKQADKSYEDKTDVTVYTQIKLADDGKFYVKQEAGCVELDTDGAHWPRATLPWIPLTWNLVRGEDYGRGLVENFAGAFHSIEVLTQSLINLAGVMGDIKFLVNPASLVDVVELNNSKAGSFHSGREGDVTAVETKKQNDAQFIVTMIDRYERQIAQAFLLNSAVTRDAERVTAEEIRYIANELETSNGGIYSRLALQWQVPTANVTLDQIGFDGSKHGIRPQIITGMDSLSRQGEMDNLRMFIGDMALLEAVPEEVRAYMHPLRFAAFIGKARQVDYMQIMKTADEVAQERAQQQEAINQQEQAKARGTVAAEAGKAAVQGD